jgi:hypothetical protein
MCFSIAKKADLAPKTKAYLNFESRFGFLVKFYPIPVLDSKISGLKLKKIKDCCGMVLSKK